MTPGEFQTSLEKRGPSPVYLFLGPDHFTRRSARQSLLAAVLGAEASDEREAGIERLDLDESSIAGVIDNAAAMSLFAQRRVLWVSNAEAALPKRITAKEEDDGPGAILAQYLRNPTPDTVIVFDCLRYGFDGDDKAKLDRVRKFYAAIPSVVEFAPFAPSDAARLARDLAKQSGLSIANAQIQTLVEACAADAGRISVEIEKLALYTDGRPATDADLAALVPNARVANVFALVGALARGDRRQALEVLDILVREGEYLPLVLTFLGTQFRLALGAVEGNARNAGQIQALYSKAGIPMWRSRAEQIAETLQAFTPEKLRRAVKLTFEADTALRDTRPDDRTVMEAFVWKLTG